MLLNQPSAPGVFLTGPTLSIGAQLRPDGVDVEDVDGDGDADVVTATSGNGLDFATVFFNGGGTFGAATNFAAGGVNPGAVLVDDFDHDGRRDIALADQDSKIIAVLRNLGGASFAAAATFAVGTNPQSLVGVDVDFNGGLDLACVNQGSDTRPCCSTGRSCSPTASAPATPRTGRPWCPDGPRRSAAGFVDRVHLENLACERADRQLVGAFVRDGRRGRAPSSCAPCAPSARAGRAGASRGPG